MKHCSLMIYGDCDGKGQLTPDKRQITPKVRWEIKQIQTKYIYFKITGHANI